MRGLAC